MSNFLQKAIKPTGVGAIKPIAPKKVAPVAPKPVAPKPVAPVSPITPPKAAPATEVKQPAATTTIKPKPAVAAPPLNKLGAKPLTPPKIDGAPKIKDIVKKPEETVEETTALVVEPKQVEEKVVEETKAVEKEVKEVKEPVAKEEAPVEIKEENKEEVKEEKKTTKKTTRKTSSKKTKAVETETEETEFIPELIPQRCERDYNEVISETVIYSAGEEWEAQCAEIDEQVKAIQIMPDMNTGTLKQATAELSQLRDTIYSEANTAKTIIESIESKISIVKQLNAKGSSPDERKLNSIKACMYHKVGDTTVNLFELEDVARAKNNFYESVMKQIEYKSKALITMNGGLKLEKDILGA